MPTYLEVENIETYLRRLRAAVPTADVLVVDDSSPDGTAGAAQQVAAELGQIDVLVRPAKTGLGNAYRAGFGLGLERGYEVLVQMDADLSHDPAALPTLLRALDDGADFAIGSRYVPGARSRIGRSTAARSRATATSTRASPCECRCPTQRRATARTRPTSSAPSTW